MAAWKHLRAIVLLPFMVTVVIPGTILHFAGVDTLGLWLSAPITRFVLPVIGSALMLVGFILLVGTIRLLASFGQGTLAPWNPTQKLVVQGVYGHVRNPMISGVVFILLGEAVLAALLPLLCWAAIFILVNSVYIPLAEEPGLAQRFGQDYEEYRRSVPRWIPRVRAWKGEMRSE